MTYNRLGWVNMLCDFKPSKFVGICFMDQFVINLVNVLCRLEKYVFCSFGVQYSVYVQLYQVSSNLIYLMIFYFLFDQLLKREVC